MSLPVRTDRPSSTRIAPLRQPARLLHATLPAPLDPLIGREQEVALLSTSLRSRQHPEGHRLLVLTGPGGVGKTRLALCVAAEVADDFADGVTFIPLAAIRDPALVASTIAKALDLHEADDRQLAERVAAFLANKELLLVLDNFEHVVDAGPLVSELLSACPNLTVLVTSRERLRLSGEHDVPVPPLCVPDSGCARFAPELAEVDSVRLFVARARAADWRATPITARFVRTVTRRPSSALPPMMGADAAIQPAGAAPVGAVCATHWSRPSSASELRTVVAASQAWTAARAGAGAPAPPMSSGTLPRAPAHAADSCAGRASGARTACAGRSSARRRTTCAARRAAPRARTAARQPTGHRSVERRTRRAAPARPSVRAASAAPLAKSAVGPRTTPSTASALAAVANNALAYTT